MKRRLIRDALAYGASDQEITVAGWVRTRRDSKAGLSFIELNEEAARPTCKSWRQPRSLTTSLKSSVCILALRSR